MQAECRRLASGNVDVTSALANTGVQELVDLQRCHTMLSMQMSDCQTTRKYQLAVSSRISSRGSPVGSGFALEHRK